MRTMRFVFAMTLFLLPQIVVAGETKYIQITTKEEMLDAQEITDLILTDDGKLIPGYVKEFFPLKDEPSIWSICKTESGYLVGTGMGKIYKFANSKFEEVFDTKEQIVTAIVQVGKEIYAATCANGKIFKMTEDQKWSEFVTLPSKHIWQIIAYKDLLYAACGTPAKVYKISFDGKFEPIYEIEAKHISSINLWDNGFLLATVEPSYLISLKEGKPFVLRDFSDVEITAVCVKEDTIYVVTNQKTGQLPYEYLKAIKARPEPVPSTPPPVEPSIPPPAQPAPPSPPQQSESKVDKISGKWKGHLEMEQFNVPFELWINLDGETVAGLITVKMAGVEAELKGTFKDDKLEFEAETPEGKGTVSAKITAQDEMEGEAKIKTDFPGVPESAKFKAKRVKVDIYGKWKGTLVTDEAKKYKFQIEIKKADKGAQVEGSYKINDSVSKFAFSADVKVEGAQVKIEAEGFFLSGILTREDKLQAGVEFAKEKIKGKLELKKLKKEKKRPKRSYVFYQPHMELICFQQAPDDKQQQPQQKEDPISGKWRGSTHVKIEAMGQVQEVTGEIEAELKLEEGSRVTGKFKPILKPGEVLPPGTPTEFEVKGTYKDKKLVLEAEVTQMEVTTKVTYNLTLIKEDHLEGDIKVEIVKLPPETPPEALEALRGMSITGTIKLVRVEKPGGAVTGQKPPEAPAVTKETPTIEMPSAPTAPAGQGTVWKLTRETAEIYTALPVYISNLHIIQDKIYLSSNARGRVFRVEGQKKWELVADFKDYAVSLGFIPVREGLYVLLGGGQAGLCLIKDQKVKEGIYISKVFDTGTTSQWGVIQAKAGQGVEIETRSGNIADPKLGWSEWERITKRSPAKVQSPSARYLQIKVTISAGSFEGTLIAYKTVNRRPQITELKIMLPAGGGGYGGAPGTATQPRVSITGHTFKQAHTSSKIITCTATDPDGDQLTYMFYYKNNDHKGWTPLIKDPLESNTYTWDTSNVPDGWYKLKVVVSDGKTRGTDTLIEEITTPEFLIDNTGPAIKVNEVTGEGISALVSDTTSNIVFVEYQVNSGEWFPVEASDGIYDYKSEEIFIKPKIDKAGVYTIVIRAYDQEMNTGITTVQFTKK